FGRAGTTYPHRTRQTPPGRWKCTCGRILATRTLRALIATSCCKKAFLRGVFLNRGFINRPEGEYHLELVINDARLAADLQKILLRFKIPARLGERKNNQFLYVKESEKIADFLPNTAFWCSFCYISGEKL
ncbi:MAG: DNA-binding protein WhiA, partial [Ferruginibacter sp.]|nr:DNA-binding protein WhiA [Ferruginibacter sp.]